MNYSKEWNEDFNEKQYLTIVGYNRMVRDQCLQLLLLFVGTNNAASRTVKEKIIMRRFYCLILSTCVLACAHIGYADDDVDPTEPRTELNFPGAPVEVEPDRSSSLHPNHVDDDFKTNKTTAPAHPPQSVISWYAKAPGWIDIGHYIMPNNVITSEYGVYRLYIKVGSQTRVMTLKGVETQPSVFLEPSSGAGKPPWQCRVVVPQGNGYTFIAPLDQQPTKCWAQPHLGVDISSRSFLTGAVIPMPYMAGFSGKVDSVGGTFNTISITPDTDPRLSIEFLHNSSVNVKPGDIVGPHTILGFTGHTGVDQIHLHIQVRVKGGGTIDPHKVLPFLK